MASKRVMRFMRPLAVSPRLRLLATAVAISAVLLLLLAQHAAPRAQASQGFYQQTNLVSDLAGVAKVTDLHLVNAWGIVHSQTSPFWISDNGTGVSTLYTGAGMPFPPAAPLVVTIPPPGARAAGTVAAPTGADLNGTPASAASGTTRIGA